MEKESSIFDALIIYDPDKAFENAIKKGLKNPEDWMYMHSTRFRDYFKNYYTRNYISYFNFSNMFNNVERMKLREKIKSKNIKIQFRRRHR